MKASLTSASLLWEMICHSTIKGILKSISWEKARASGLAFRVVDVVECIEYIVVASPSSTRGRTSCGVRAGRNKRKVFSTIP